MPILQQRNIIVCLFDALSELSREFLDTKSSLPTYTSLQSNSLRFSRAYTPCPESSPARASLFTGLDPCVHGLWCNGVTLRDAERTFAQRLKQAGYASYLAGRYQLSGVSRWTTEQCRKGEFDQFNWAHGPMHRSRQNGYLNWLKEAAPGHYATLFEKQADPDNTEITTQQQTNLAALPDELSFNHWVGQGVIQWIDSVPLQKPFVAIAGFSVGDGLGAEPYAQSDAEALQACALKQADMAMRQLLENLHASNRAGDTVIIITAARGNSLPDCEHAMQETAIKVPLLIVSDELEPQLIMTPVSTIDIAPTILNIANAPIGPRMQGRSLLASINRTNKTDAWALSRLRTGASTEQYPWQSALCTQNMKLVIQHGLQGATADGVSLYDLEVDPAEQNNLARQSNYAQELEHMLDYMIDARCAMEDRTEPRVAEF